MRAVVAITLHYGGFSSRLAPDEDTYFQIGRALSLYWSGDAFTAPGRLSSDEPFAYFYLNAISYWHLRQRRSPEDRQRPPGRARLPLRIRHRRGSLRLEGRSEDSAPRGILPVTGSLVLAQYPGRLDPFPSRFPFVEELPGGGRVFVPRTRPGAGRHHARQRLPPVPFPRDGHPPGHRRLHRQARQVRQKRDPRRHHGGGRRLPRAARSGGESPGHQPRSRSARGKAALPFLRAQEAPSSRPPTSRPRKRL